MEEPMQRRRAIRTIATASAASLLPGFGSMFAQAAGDVRMAEKSTIRSVVRLVLLDVSVKDRRGHLVAGLVQDNFAVLENGVRQTITVFSSNDVPVTAGILLDESASMIPKRNEVLSAAETFVLESNPQDELFVLHFSDSVVRGLPEGTDFSSSIPQLRSALRRVVPMGKTALYDAIIAGLHQLEGAKREKKALLVISDGGDNASLNKRTEMLDRLERNIATVYTIGLFTPGEPDQNPAILRQVAQISGGEAWFPQSVEGMTGVCRTIATDIRTRYTIGYVPKESNGAGALRHIQVRASAPGRSKLIARTRNTYRYDE
jgi:Ca-activated chloride channel homolog